MLIQALKRTARIVVLLGLASLVLSNLEILAQSRNKQASRPLSSVPAHQRARLIRRLNRLVKYQGTRQWGKMYFLSRASIKHKKSREAFVNDQKKLETVPHLHALLAFTPIEAITLDESQNGGLWEVFGCAKYSEKKSTANIKARVTAELYENEWFFSEVGAATQVDGPEEPCSIPKRSPPQTRRKGMIR